MPSPLVPHSSFIGEFYANLTASIFGGTISGNGVNNSEQGNPDVINSSRNQVYESKGAMHHDVHKIYAEQVGHYKSITQSSAPLDHPEAYYFLWTYGPRGVAGLSESELRTKLLAGTKSLLVLSLDILEAGVSCSKPWPITGSRGWKPYHMLTPTTRNSLATNPILELTRLGLPAHDYHMISRVVKDTEYQEDVVNDFKQVQIYHKSMRGLQ